MKEVGGTATTPSVKDYSNGALTVRIDLKSAGDGERGSHLFSGELIVLYGSNTVTESVYGASGC